MNDHNKAELRKRYIEVYRMLLDLDPPTYLVGDPGSLNDDQYIELQEFCASHSTPEWMTGLSIIEAAESIVDSAIINANIDKDGHIP